MELHFSHNAFDGSSDLFNQFRQTVCFAIGGSYPPHNADILGELKLDPDAWYWGPDYDEKTHPGLAVFFRASDRDKKISPEDCTNIANELEALILKIEKDIIPLYWIVVKDIAKIPGICRQFILGCRDAARAGEYLEYLVLE